MVEFVHSVLTPVASKPNRSIGIKARFLLPSSIGPIYLVWRDFSVGTFYEYLFSYKLGIKDLRQKRYSLDENFKHSILLKTRKNKGEPPPPPK